MKNIGGVEELLEYYFPPCFPFPASCSLYFTFVSFVFFFVAGLVWPCLVLSCRRFSLWLSSTQLRCFSLTSNDGTFGLSSKLLELGSSNHHHLPSRYVNEMHSGSPKSRVTYFGTSPLHIYDVFGRKEVAEGKGMEWNGRGRLT